MKIGNYNIEGDLILEYLQHINSGYIDEVERKRLHDKIFESIKVYRNSKEGQELSKKLDEFCDSMIADDTIKMCKRIGRSSQDELDKINNTIKTEAMTENYISHELDDLQLEIRKKLLICDNHCRICGKELVDRVARVNDHLLDNDDSSITSAICMECADNNPDERFIAFRKKHWSH